jgi:hypothetical protein
MTPPKRPNGGELQTTQNPSSTHWSTFIISRKLGTITAKIDWRAPRGLYRLCGKQAYVVLPSSWLGSCILGSIRPPFLLPLRQGEKLGVTIYEERLSSALQIDSWKDNDLPPKQIIQYYGPATWAEDRSWGYHTPTYMLNSCKLFLKL